MPRLPSETSGNATCSHNTNGQDRESCESCAESRLSLTSTGYRYTAEDLERHQRQTREYVFRQEREWTSRLAAPAANPEPVSSTHYEQALPIPSGPATGSRRQSMRFGPYLGQALSRAGPSRTSRPASSPVNGAPRPFDRQRAQRRQGYQQRLGRPQDVLQLGSNPALSTYPIGSALVSYEALPEPGTRNDTLRPSDPFPLVPFPPPPRYQQQILEEDLDEDLNEREEVTEEDHT